MAKWGEGDPRWIVEERPDATNVNNWHWTEKNASSWSIERIKELFKDLKINSDLATISIKEVDKCEGEASANNRKGKLIFFYEWELTLKWQGKLNDCSGDQISGTIKIPNLSEENDVSELDIQISVKDENSEEVDKLKEIMLTAGKKIVRQQLDKYISSLKEEFSKGMILPKKDEIKQDSVKNLSSGFNKKINMNPVNSDTTTKKVELKFQTGNIEIKQEFQCKAQEIYDALTKIEMVTAFTRGHVKLEAIKGGKFEMFTGNIHGTYEELVPGKRIVQKWRCKQWPDGHYSTVTFNIEEKNDHTELVLVQTGVPVSEVPVTRENWQRYYWDPIKRTFGFGAFL